MPLAVAVPLQGRRRRLRSAWRRSWRTHRRTCRSVQTTSKRAAAAGGCRSPSLCRCKGRRRRLAKRLEAELEERTNDLQDARTPAGSVLAAEDAARRRCAAAREKEEAGEAPGGGAGGAHERPAEAANDLQERAAAAEDAARRRCAAAREKEEAAKRLEAELEDARDLQERKRTCRSVLLC
ncbi:hypothetical protein TcBrA4_0071680 [Trypanosoma cruzi]|nr:hypothetical protein TcBrA4_0071680 [Trypanosoma cruzi]